MKFDTLLNSGIELTDAELKSIYGGSGGDDGGQSGVSVLDGVLDGNDISVPINLVGSDQTGSQDVRSVRRGGDDED